MRFCLLALLVGCACLSQTVRFERPSQSERDKVRAQMRLRPGDPWPRGTGHVVLALPGSREEEKAYHEPGGDFSPTVGSFGVSIWPAARPADIRQRFHWSDDRDIPDLVTETPRYKSRWYAASPRVWNLELTGKEQSIVFRSVGPAGGPLHDIDWNGRRLALNGQWTIEIEPQPTLVSVGEEGSADWIAVTQASASPAWRGESGWGYARFRFNECDPCRISITDSADRVNRVLTNTKTETGIQLKLPDARFADSLNAQVAHLMMGLVRAETRPGEPTNYPLPWLRDGAYTVTALARVGQLDTAKQLSNYFAEHDFFGGFGAEADGPGLALWALEEVASRVQRPVHDRYLWPHVKRKANLIVTMMTATQPIRMKYSGPIVPKHRRRTDNDLVCEPAKDGLIVGRMDHHRPLLFVNAVSYRGLLSAAAFAERTMHTFEAGQWRDKAEQLRKAWETSLSTKESANERTLISGLWPTGVAGERRAEFGKALGDKPWKPSVWSYFDVAQAHQWLYLGDVPRAWQIVDWYWNNQSSPGLYTWSEGTGEENSFRRWEGVRGWVDPKGVTPHYWTSAEMLLLQLDMLGYLDGDTLVVGGGIPESWRKSPMSVKALPVADGRVDWEWNGKRLKVDTRGKKWKIRPGPALVHSLK